MAFTAQCNRVSDESQARSILSNGDGASRRCHRRKALACQANCYRSHTAIDSARREGRYARRLDGSVEGGMVGFKSFIVGTVRRLVYVHEGNNRSEEHTSELQSLRHLVC